MAITYPLDLPAVAGIRNARLSPMIPVAVTQSEFTGAQQVQQHPGEWWQGEFSLPVMKMSDAELWNVFFLKLRGRYGTFLMGDPARATPQGSMGVTPGTPQLNGSHSARATEISIKTGLGSVTGYAKAGDYIQLGSGSAARLHKLLADIDLVSGNASNIPIFPFLRTSYANNTTVVVNSAKGVFRLADNNVSWDIDEAMLYQKGFTIVEAL